MNKQHREDILARIANANVPHMQHPGRYEAAALPDTTIEEIIAASGAVSAKSVNFLAELPAERCYSLVEEMQSSISPEVLSTSHGMLSIHTTVCTAEFIVRENGAMWIQASGLSARAALFTCEHLVVLLSATEIRQTMHDAMREIAQHGHPVGYFIAGPSKTADIEQCLVIGAQGARRVTVVLT